MTSLSVRNFVFPSLGIFTKSTPVRHIPEWLPWLSYKPLARIGHNLGNEVVYTPLQFVKESIVSRRLCLKGSQRLKWHKIL